MFSGAQRRKKWRVFFLAKVKIYPGIKVLTHDRGFLKWHEILDFWLLPRTLVKPYENKYFPWGWVSHERVHLIPSETMENHCKTLSKLSLSPERIHLTTSGIAKKTIVKRCPKWGCHMNGFIWQPHFWHPPETTKTPYNSLCFRNLWGKLWKVKTSINFHV